MQPNFFPNHLLLGCFQTLHRSKLISRPYFSFFECLHIRIGYARNLHIPYTESSFIIRKIRILGVDGFLPLNVLEKVGPDLDDLPTFFRIFFKFFVSSVSSSSSSSSLDSSSSCIVFKAMDFSFFFFALVSFEMHKRSPSNPQPSWIQGPSLLQWKLP